MGERCCNDTTQDHKPSKGDKMAKKKATKKKATKKAAKKTTRKKK